jgi:hypothetical protein
VQAQRKREEDEAEAMFAEMARRRDVEMLEAAAAVARHRREREREASEIIARQLEERAMERELELVRAAAVPRICEHRWSSYEFMNCRKPKSSKRSK